MKELKTTVEIDNEILRLRLIRRKIKIDEWKDKNRKKINEYNRLWMQKKRWNDE